MKKAKKQRSGGNNMKSVAKFFCSCCTKACPSKGRRMIERAGGKVYVCNDCYNIILKRQAAVKAKYF